MGQSNICIKIWVVALSLELVHPRVAKSSTCTEKGSKCSDSDSDIAEPTLRRHIES